MGHSWGKRQFRDEMAECGGGGVLISRLVHEYGSTNHAGDNIHLDAVPQL